MLKKQQVQVHLKNHKPCLCVSPEKPFGVYFEKQEGQTQLAAIKIETDLSENLLEEVLWVHPSPLDQREEDTWQLFWSDDHNKVALIGANHALLVFDFINQHLYSKKNHIDTKHWSYFQYSQEIFSWFPQLARLQKNKALENACFDFSGPISRLKLYKEALKTEVIVPITEPENKEHFYVSFQHKEQSIVCAFVNDISANTHLPEHKHFKVVPFAQLCKQCSDFKIDALQLYCNNSDAITIELDDLKTLSLGLSDTKKDVYHNLDWVEDFLEDVKSNHTQFANALGKLLAKWPHFQAAYLIKARLKDSFNWLCLITDTQEIKLNKTFWDELHDIKKTYWSKDQLFEQSFLFDQDDISKQITRYIKPFYKKT